MNIPSIIIVNIMHFLSVKDIINLSLTSKTTIDDSTWKIYAYLKWWNKQFWDKAVKRSPQISKPYYIWKHEVIRILKFEYYSSNPVTEK